MNSKNEIIEHLRFMSHMEIVLNMNTEEFLNKFLLLSKKDQVDFISGCETQLEKINLMFKDIKKMLSNSVLKS